MSSSLLSRRDLDFLLYEWLQVETLTARAYFAEHSRETFDAALDAYESIATDLFAPHNKKNDQHEPLFDGERVTLMPEVRVAVRAFAESGLMSARHDIRRSGMQLPQVLERAGMAYVFAANISTAAYPFLTMANASLLLAHASADIIDRYAQPLLTGRFLGTMCLSEPQAGSSLADITTRAELQADGTYRVHGSKMWVSGGEHDLSENIVHLLLAKIPGPDGKLRSGVQGISLFLVPKRLVDADGRLGERNDIALAGLNHKMGYRGTTNCLLSFGEGRFQPRGRAGAIGILIGEAGQGLAYMFHMMNEARVGVGVGATALGYSGYLQSLEYAHGRRQGRPVTHRDVTCPPIPIIEHADVRRMLLAQKAYVEGALALVLYCAWLLDESGTAPDEAVRRSAVQRLDLLTPIAKSWPSQWCLAANDLAIQVHGGYGYTRDFNVEQLYRDNRLNPIHEGTHGIQALDLLGRKVSLHDGAALQDMEATIRRTIERALSVPALDGQARALNDFWTRLGRVTAALLQLEDAGVRLANATPYMEAFGHAIVAWLWLEQALIAAPALERTRSEGDGAFYQGKLQAGRYFFHWELPKVDAWLNVLDPVDRSCLDMRPEWF